METFLLNPNVAAQKPVAQQDTSGVESNSEDAFSPLLNEAVNSRKDGEVLQDNTEQTDSNIFEQGNASEILNETNNTNLFSNTIETALINTPEVPGKNVLSQQAALTPGITAELAKEQLQSQSGKFEQIVDTKVLTNFTQESPAPVSLQSSNNDIGAPTKAESLLLEQIQQILDQGRNNGSIIINRDNNPLTSTKSQTDTLQNLSNPLLADSENGEIQARQIGITPISADDTPVASQKAAKLEGAHQNISEQYLNAKLGESKNSNSENLQQNNSQQKGAEQQGKNDLQTLANGLPETAVSEGKVAATPFGQQLGLNTSTTQATSYEGKMAPGAEIPVPEKEMVNNLIQRFNVNPRLQTSKLTMQLHPAELGALKIDLLVKGDSIQANIVAQSQQIIDTLEKHMPRLRSVLQEQGFSIDSFEISMDGDGGNQKELFQEHFNSQQQGFTFNKSSSQQPESFDALLSSTEDADEKDNDASGVNLTV